MKRQLDESPAKQPEDSEPPSKRLATDSAENNDESPKVGLSKPAIFGNFGTFSFGAITPKANPFGEPSKDGDAKADNPWAEPAPAIGEDAKKDKYAQVELKEQTVTTGEENESTLFSSRARLYALSFADTAAGWKERGVGVLKINENAEGKARIVMRSEGLLRVVLNVPLAQNTRIGKGFKSSLVTEKFVQFVGIEKDIPHKYALKLPSKELANELFEVLDARPETILETIVEKLPTKQETKSVETTVEAEAKLEADAEKVQKESEPVAEAQPTAADDGAKENGPEDDEAEEDGAEDRAEEDEETEEAKESEATQESESVGSEAAELETAEPETAEPETAEPETAEPETAEPETTESETAELET